MKFYNSEKGDEQYLHNACSRNFELVDINRYREFEDGDSVRVIAKKTR